MQFPVVSMVDDFNVGVGQCEATLLRIRGYMAVHPTGDTVAGSYLAMCGAAVYDDDDVAITDWRQVVNYTREDVLWTAGDLIRLPTTVPVHYSHAMHFDVDIKAKRRLKSGQNVRVEMTVDVPTGGQMVVIGALRALLKMR